MLTGNLPPQSRRATYVEQLELTDGDAPHDLIDWGGVTAVKVALRDVDGEVDRLVATLGAGVTLPSPGILVWRFEADALSTLPAKTYRFLIDATASDGQVVEIADAFLPLT